MAKYTPALPVAVVSYMEEDKTFTDKTTGRKEAYTTRTLNWISPELGVVGSCPVPERLAADVRALGRAPSNDCPNARLYLAGFGYEHGQLRIVLDHVEAIA